MTALIAELLPRYNAVVLGAGPSGSTVATALARGSLTVLMIEEQRKHTFKVGESLPGIARRVISGAGFPNVFRKVSQIKCSGNRSCWGSPKMRLRPGFIDPYGGGVHVDRAEFDEELVRESEAAGTKVLSGARFLRSVRSKASWSIFLRYGRQICNVECDSIVDCTGRRACFARTQSIQRVVIDKQVAVVAVLSGQGVNDDDLTTTIETVPEGWWYSARIPNSRRVVVFFTDGDLLRKLHARSSEGFSSLMRQSIHVRKFLSLPYRIERHPAIVLADTSYLTTAAGSGWCAAGDAAAALDPLGSSGIIDAVKSGSAAASLVLAGFKDIEGYSLMMSDKAKTNIKTRRSYYQMETRWPCAPFWARRRENRV